MTNRYRQALQQFASDSVLYLKLPKATAWGFTVEDCPEIEKTVLNPSSICYISDKWELQWEGIVAYLPE